MCAFAPVTDNKRAITSRPRTHRAGPFKFWRPILHGEPAMLWARLARRGAPRARLWPPKLYSCSIYFAKFYSVAFVLLARARRVRPGLAWTG